MGERESLCGEEYKKEGEETVFVCVVSGPKQRVTEREAFGVRWHPSHPEPAKTEILQQQPKCCSPDDSLSDTISVLGCIFDQFRYFFRQFLNRFEFTLLRLYLQPSSMPCQMPASSSSAVGSGASSGSADATHAQVSASTVAEA